jgi:hypothetical protein
VNHLAPNTARVVLSVAALPASVSGWTIALLLSRLELTGAGLVSGLHPLWFGSVALATVGMFAAIVQRRHSALLLSYAITTLAMVASTGVLLERSPRFPYVFTSYQYGEAVLLSGSIDFSQVYLSWPGWHIVSAVMAGASGIDAITFLTWFPVWLTATTFLALLTLMRRFRLPRRQRWVALALAVTTFLGPAYPLPGAVAFTILIYVGALMLEGYGRRALVGPRLGLIMLLAALVPTHMLTSTVAVVVVGATSAIAALAFRRSTGSAVLIAAALIASYLLYVAVEVTVAFLPEHVSAVLDLERLFASILGSTATAIAGGSADHLLVVRVRIAYVVVLAGLAVLGIVLMLLRRAGWRRWTAPTAWLAGGASSVGLGAYGGEIVARAAALATPGTLALASWVATSRRGLGLIVAIAAVAVTFTPLNLYGNELFDHIRPTELAADDVLASHRPQPVELHRPSRTWYLPVPRSDSGPYVVVYGPLYDIAYGHIGVPNPPVMSYWSYDNGDIRIMVSREAPS